MQSSTTLCSTRRCTSSHAPLTKRPSISLRSRRPSRSASSCGSTASLRLTCSATPTAKIKSQGKSSHKVSIAALLMSCSIRFRLSFLKVVSKYFDSDLCLAKIKVDERLKTIAFDEKNNRLTVMSYDRVLYFFDIPA